MSSAVLLTEREIVNIAVDKIKPNPYQPRRFFDSASLEELSRSIKEFGIIQPISVRLINGNGYELVTGERRLRASKLVGLETIPAIVININDQESAVIAIIENLQRQNLNFIEEAEGFQNLMHDYSFTQEQLAEKLGKSQSSIANKIRLLKLPKTVQKKLLENELTERHARALLRLADEKVQLDIVDKIVKNGLTVKNTEELIERLLTENKSAIEKDGENRKIIKRCVKDIRLFTNTVKQSVEMLVNMGISAEYILEEQDDGCDILIRVNY